VKTLGIVDGHSASVALVEDGRVTFALQEERPTREKNRGGFPGAALSVLLETQQIALGDIDQIGFCTSYYFNTDLSGRRAILDMYRSAFVPTERRRDWIEGVAPALGDIKRQQQARTSKVEALGAAASRVSFLEHHFCHACTAYYSCGNFSEKVLVLTCDGQGDMSSASVFVGENRKLRKLHDVAYQHSVGQLYSYVTFLLGFVPLEHEYKLMGMAPYSERAAGSARIRDLFQRHFAFSGSDPLGWSRTSPDSTGHGLARLIEGELRFARFDEIAAGLQMFVEDFVCEWIERVVKHTGVHKVVLSGGIFMNVKLNKRLNEMACISGLFVAPSCGDESNSIGAAYHLQCSTARAEPNGPALGPLYLGPEPSQALASAAIKRATGMPGIEAAQVADPDARCAALLSDGHIVARFAGRAEFGARALGNRSILARPDKWEMVTRINQAIKQRDFWMPFAPSIMEERAAEVLVGYEGGYSPYMMLAFDVEPSWHDRLMAATHPYDKTCRPQIVRREWNSSYHSIIRQFCDLTGIPAILNTSFNLHGYPIVDSPAEALDVFLQSGLRHLVMGDWLISKSD